MPTPVKVDPKQAANAAKDKLKNNQLSKTAGDIFNKIKAKTAIDPKKIDAFQKSWLALPENRKKYEHLQDAPQVAAEEMLAMTNDIIEFCQGKDSANSHLFAKIKEKTKSPMDKVKAFFTKAKMAAASAATKAKQTAGAGAAKAKKGAEQAKAAGDKAKDAANKAKDVAGKVQK